ncbi:MAG: 50S ribosomal protein L9 [Treponema sp.]|jgi:large subunit ribosomal protein L9|nr:50S ribosomal protein L9 [Treponema sp.]
MKVILNKDLATLGEEGDVRDVARGYFRNYLFPRGIAVPYNDKTVKIFEARKDEIAVRKAEKRKAAVSLKEKLEALELLLTMPAGANGKLYGAVTNQTISDELIKQGFQLERKRIEIPGNSFKSVGKYKITIKLYEGEVAEISLTVQAQAVEIKASTTDKVRRRREDRRKEAGVAETQTKQAVAPKSAVVTAVEQNAQT